MTRPIVLVIPGDVADLSPNQRLHWREERRRERQWQWLAWCAWREAGAHRFEGHVRISFLIRRGCALDADNAAGSRALKGAIRAALPEEEAR